MSAPTSSSFAEAFKGWPPPVLDPAGPFSNSVTTLAWVLMAGAVAIFLLVCVAMWVALYGSDALRAKLGGERVVKWFGLVIPAGVLLLLLVWGLTLVRGLTTIQGDELRMRVSGNLYWWRVSYLDAAGRELHADANELHIPVGRPVVVDMVSEDVIHSFWVPKLGGKMDMIPGRTNRLKLQADKPGSYGGQCAEFCGGAHSLMGFVVVAHEAADWQRWMDARLKPAPAGLSVEALRGRQLFNEVGCAACHRVAGTDAQGIAGPDLTHVGSRLSLGAGILPNTRATLIGWIADSQSIKPNNRMPAYRSLKADELNALASYMESLK
ncbi:cytochrome c oxidase subunit II [Roseateles asaccharophilus]|uniref:cytochrome-c oxidase n=1 Tax=Roseateles asaccharophilus TaxID=582607 RepID=A0ABU2ADM1_9BURK|nr:cytochrome c oxidase subunit II [Roseateles asaccharophilus]MDR7335297.1 cytochrome c oxidase subunit 2 [Roseateles asaccharophilus]